MSVSKVIVFVCYHLSSISSVIVVVVVDVV